MDSPQSARSASKTLDSIEQIRLNRERRREGIEQARQARLQQEQLEQHEVDRAAAFIAKQRPAREALKHKSLGRSGSLGALKPPRYGLEFRKMIDDFRSSVDFGSGLSTVSADDSTLDASMHKLASPKLDSSRHLSSSSRLSVFVRKRPLTASEVHARYFDVVTMLDDETVTVHEPKTRVDLSRTIENHAFLLDAVFDEHTTSREVYEVS